MDEQTIQTVRAHRHAYIPHVTHPDGAGKFYCCTLCGFSLPAHLLPYALANGARLSQIDTPKPK